MYAGKNMLNTSILKTLLASTLILGVVLPVKAQVGPGLGNTDSVSGYRVESYGRVCTHGANGRLSLRVGPGQGHKKIKEIPNGNLVALVGGKYSSDGFFWWNVLHNGSRGWARADYVCGDPQ